MSMSKSAIIRELGEECLLLPQLVNSALDANERAKYFLTLLQSARAHADQPDRPASSLVSERLAAGVGDDRFDAVVAGTHNGTAGVYDLPELEPVVGGVLEAIGEMVEPLREAAGSDAAAADNFDRRLASLQQQLPALENGQLSGDLIDAMTSGARGQGDSLHLLVMDLHKELNRLQQEIASESVDGASVYGIREEDRAPIAAFMRGVNGTRELKFDHPGLGTTATRIGERLVIQNDIGTTDAHVLVVQVEQLAAKVTHTDVHLERLMFFRRGLDNFDMTWSDIVSRPTSTELESVYHLCIGTFSAPDQRTLEAFLERLGARLVYLIDWNRARKQLSALVGKRESIELLEWAADQGFGHMAFLKVGGQQLLYEAVELASRVPLTYGQPLRELFGQDTIGTILRFALRTAAQGLLAGTSRQLILDEIRAEVSRHLRSVEQSLMDVAAEHAELIVEAAMAVSEGVLRGPGVADGGFAQRNAARGKRWEHQADELVNRVRAVVRRVRGMDGFERLLSTLDDAMDDLEEAIFLLTLLPDAAGRPGSISAVTGLTGVALGAAQEQLKAIETARQAPTLAAGAELQDILEAVDRVMSAEHAGDDAHRAAKAAIVAKADDFREMQIALEIARAIEDSIDSLMRSMLVLRDYVLREATTK